MMPGDIVYLKRDYNLFYEDDEFKVVSTHEGGIIGLVLESELHELIGSEFYIPYEALDCKESMKVAFDENYVKEIEYPGYVFNLNFEEDILDLVVDNAATVKERLIDRALLEKDKALFEYAISGKLDWEAYEHG